MRLGMTTGVRGIAVLAVVVYKRFPFLAIGANTCLPTIRQHALYAVSYAVAGV